MASGTDDSFGINRTLNLTIKVGDMFKKFSIRQNGLQPSNTLHNSPHGYHVREEINSNVFWYPNKSLIGFKKPWSFTHLMHIKVFGNVTGISYSI